MSRTFVARIRATLAELMSRWLDDVRLALLMLRRNAAATNPNPREQAGHIKNVNLSRGCSLALGTNIRFTPCGI